jgi:hypothetical protein
MTERMPRGSGLSEFQGRWQIAEHPQVLKVWSATRQRGNRLRTVVATTPEGLAARLREIEYEEP